MRVILQRVSSASVSVNSVKIGECNKGYMILVGFCESDTKEIINKMIDKIIKLRVFEDNNGKMNLSLLDVKGSILSISQFTLYADTNSGRRPSFSKAAKKDVAIPLYDYFNKTLNNLDIHTETGEFGADMQVSLVNDGPVTIYLDSENM